MRTWLVWIAFAACLLVVLAAMGWVSVTVLRLDVAETTARQHAELEENVRLALWRMDSSLAPLIARESTWPYFAYSSFYPAQRAYTNMLSPIGQGEVLMPSPLLTQPSPQVLVHFQIGPADEFNSPQAPTGKMRELAENGYTTAQAITTATQRLSQLKPTLGRDVLASLLQALNAEAPKLAMLPPDANQAQAQLGSSNQQTLDLPLRNERQQQQVVMQQPVHRSQTQVPPQSARPSGKGADEYAARDSNMLANSQVYYPEQADRTSQDVQEGMTRPLWMSGRLLLARRVRANNAEYVQGCWLDWPALERDLLNTVQDLLPQARLEPVQDLEPANGQGHMLAALPVRLLPGELPASLAGRHSPVRISLVVAWVCAVLAVVAVAVLLQGAMSLSERRGAFVSAVTHEMRTPLTTFRMYTEMLAKGMVPEEKRVRYLDTLRVEGDRLSHLVENVLSYARLERGKSPTTSTTTVSELLERIQGRLVDRAEQAGMRLEVSNSELAEWPIQADPGAVEQILFNLVDNACKYASVAEDRTIRLDVQATGRRVLFVVSDRGPGIATDRRRQLFRPFSKSARQAAHSAPGIGLGLALSRRLARQLGGDLRYEPVEGVGARFVLELRSSQSTRRE
jgi:signal transduction histidine kinase